MAARCHAVARAPLTVQMPVSASDPHDIDVHLDPALLLRVVRAILSNGTSIGLTAGTVHSCSTRSAPVRPPTSPRRLPGSAVGSAVLRRLPAQMPSPHKPSLGVVYSTLCHDIAPFSDLICPRTSTPRRWRHMGTALPEPVRRVAGRAGGCTDRDVDRHRCARLVLVGEFAPYMLPDLAAPRFRGSAGPGDRGFRRYAQCRRDQQLPVDLPKRMACRPPSHPLLRRASPSSPSTGGCVMIMLRRTLVILVLALASGARVPRSPSARRQIRRRPHPASRAPSRADIPARGRAPLVRELEQYCDEAPHRRPQEVVPGETRPSRSSSRKIAEALPQIVTFHGDTFSIAYDEGDIWDVGWHYLGQEDQLSLTDAETGTTDTFAWRIDGDQVRRCHPTAPMEPGSRRVSPEYRLTASATSSRYP